jgi:hypothetical protein
MSASLPCIVLNTAHAESHRSCRSSRLDLVILPTSSNVLALGKARVHGHQPFLRLYLGSEISGTIYRAYLSQCIGLEDGPV